MHWNQLLFLTTNTIKVKYFTDVLNVTRDKTPESYCSNIKTFEDNIFWDVTPYILV